MLRRRSSGAAASRANSRWRTERRWLAYAFYRRALCRQRDGDDAEAQRDLESVGLADYVDEIVRSGLPGLRIYRGRALRAQLHGYLDRIVDTDFEDQGLSVRRPETLRRWIAAYAAATATTASLETIRDAATGGQRDKPSRGATQPWRDVLERLWIVDPVPAWRPTQNPLNGLAQLPTTSPTRRWPRRCSASTRMPC